MREFLLSTAGFAVIMGVVLAVGIVVLFIDKRRHPEHYHEHFSDYPDEEE